MVWEAVQAVLMIFALIATGVILTKKGWFDERVEQLFSKLVIYVALPGMILNNLLSSYTRESLMEGIPGLIALLISQPLSIVLGYLVAGLFRVPRARRGVFVVMFSFSNSVFIGLPVVQALFGSAATPYALLFYIVNTMLFWTAGIFGIARDAGSNARFFSAAALKRLISPPLIMFAVCLALISLDIKLPSFIMGTAQYLGGLVTPLSLFFTGINIANMGLKGLKPDFSMVLVCVGRFVVTPALVIITILLMERAGIAFGDGMLRDVFVIQASMPVMAQTAILAGAYGADREYATMGLALTSAISLLVLPFFRVMLTWL